MWHSASELIIQCCIIKIKPIKHATHCISPLTVKRACIGDVLDSRAVCWVFSCFSIIFSSGLSCVFYRRNVVCVCIYILTIICLHVFCVDDSVGLSVTGGAHYGLWKPFDFIYCCSWLSLVLHINRLFFQFHYL